MIQERQPELAAQVVRSLEEGVDTPALHAAASCAIEPTGVMGFAPPSWSDLALAWCATAGLATRSLFQGGKAAQERHIVPSVDRGGQGLDAVTKAPALAWR